MRHFASFVVFLLLPIACMAAVTAVPQDSATIQGAIAGAFDGDTVLVADGHYYERLNLLGKSLLITSWIMYDGDLTHALNTVIDADTLVLGAVDTGSVIRADGYPAVPVSAVVQGFTIQNGFAEDGGGIFCRHYELELRNCILQNNSAGQGGVAHIHYDWTALILDSCTVLGGGHSIVSNYPWSSSVDTLTRRFELTNSLVGDTEILLRLPARFSNSTLYNSQVTAFQSPSVHFITNSVLHQCAVRAIDDGFPAIENSFLFDTDLTCDVFSGASISHSLIKGRVAVPSAELSLKNSTIIGVVDLGSGSGSVPEPIENCIIVTDGSPAVICGNPDYLALVCCDIFGCDSTNWLHGDPQQLDTSNLYFLDPRFCSPESNDYSLYNTSPCLPLQNDCETLIGALGVGCYVARGDVDGSGYTDLDDALHLLAYIFFGGPPPVLLEIADVDCSGAIDIDDAVYIIQYIFAAGPPPCD